MKSSILALIGVAILAAEAKSFDLPKTDPWYYQDHRHISFWVPDKAQHYWGSQLLCDNLKSLPFPNKEASTPFIAFGLGFLYEVYQERQGIGFSDRDLIADALGVVSSVVNSDNFKLWLSYDVVKKEIIWNMTLTF